MKRYICLAIISLIVMGLLLGSFPKTTTYEGIYMSSDSEEAKPITLNLERTISFKSIVNPRKLYGKITISPYNLDISSDASFKFVGETTDFKDGVYSVNLTRYNNKSNEMTFATLWFDKTLKNILITEQNDINLAYVAASDKFAKKVQKHM